MKHQAAILEASLVLVAVLSVGQHYPSQGQASGGRIPSTPKSNTSKPAKTPTPSKRTSTMDRIDGKWWTTGNDFGPSELVLTQNGNSISGTIKWADGRSGTINGTFTNKRLKHTWSDTSGSGGSGWLELSWANFLGGPWRNQQGKDGSWTLNRIEGQWCFGGDRKRFRKVTHDARGQLTIVTEYGETLDGHMEGPHLYLDVDGQSLKGDMFYKGNRLNFVNGSYWTWCGS
jgi:hypothetical protein